MNRRRGFPLYVLVVVAACSGPTPDEPPITSAEAFAAIAEPLHKWSPDDMDRTEVAHVDGIGNDVWCAQLHHTRRDYSDTAWYSTPDTGVCYVVGHAFPDSDGAPRNQILSPPVWLVKKLREEGKWPSYVTVPP